MPFKNKEQKSEYSRNHYQETKLKKEKNKRYQQTHRDKKKMERDQENRDQLAELPTTNNGALSHTSAPTRKSLLFARRLKHQPLNSVYPKQSLKRWSTPRKYNIQQHQPF